MTPKTLSIIVPTNRSQELLVRCLGSLGEQTSPPDEIVIVDDNPKPTLVAPAHPIAVRVVHSRGSGLSVARNLGAQAAVGEVVMFFDDDLVASPTLVERHRAAHTSQTPTAVVGYCQPVPTIDNWISQSAAGWWDQLYARMMNEPATFTFFCAGHMSIPRPPLLGLGGFDPSLPYGREDWELGLRWLDAGYLIRYEPSAAAQHAYTMNALSRLRRVAIEGHADTVLAARYPQTIAALPLATHRPIRDRPLLHRAIFRSLGAPLVRDSCARTLNVLERTNCRRLWQRLFNALEAAAYDHGIRRARR
jgi:GT2 family glycosyltransferase